MKNLLKGLFIVITAIAILLKYGEMRKAKNRAYLDAYPQAIEEHLESKYGKKFIINPEVVQQSSSPVPFSSMYAPCEFKVSEDEYVFYVFVYPESKKNYKIKKIQDNYYWKSINEETKEYLEQEMTDLLPKDYKIIFRHDLNTFFDDDLKPGIPMEMFFKTVKNKKWINLYVITPPQSGTESSKLSENSVYPILYNFYLKNHSNIEIEFYYNQTETFENYKNIDVKKYESAIYYYDFEEYKSLWSLLGTEHKIAIEIK